MVNYIAHWKRKIFRRKFNLWMNDYAITKVFQFKTNKMKKKSHPNVNEHKWINAKIDTYNFFPLYIMNEYQIINKSKKQTATYQYRHINTHTQIYLSSLITIIYSTLYFSLFSSFCNPIHISIRCCLYFNKTKKKQPKWKSE